MQISSIFCYIWESETQWGIMGNMQYTITLYTTLLDLGKPAKNAISIRNNQK